MKVYLAADHGGFALKEKLKPYLAELGHEVKDLGAYELNPDDDYPDFVLPMAEKVAVDSGSLGVVMCRSGNGEVIAANKVKGIRAALGWNEEVAKKARQDNDANILAVGADYIDTESAKQIIKIFLETPFSNHERHKRRIATIQEYETAQHS